MDDTEVGGVWRLQNCDKKIIYQFLHYYWSFKQQPKYACKLPKGTENTNNEKPQLINWLFFKRLINLNNNETMNIILS